MGIAGVPVEDLLLYAIYFFLGSIIVGIIRVIRGPTIADRMTGLNLVGSQVLAILVLVAVRENQPNYLDVALVYDIFGFIGILAMARYFSRKVKT
jgi:multicomponent Na+:H+ antiporter subunit F